MKENTQEKLLIQVNENNIFYKIKRFFRKLFHKETIINNTEIIEQNKIEKSKSVFIETIKNIEDEETRLLELQRKYRAGELKEEELTKEQVKSLCNLYSKQIESLRKSNEIRKQKLLEYRKKVQIENLNF